MQDETRTRLVLFCGVLGVTSSAFIIRAADQPPYILAATRVLLTGLIALFVLNRDYRFAVPNPIKRNIILAGVALATHFGWWFDSLGYLNVGTSLSLTNTAPVWMAIFVFMLFKKKPKQNQMISIGWVIFGSFVLFQGSATDSVNLRGLLLALGSAIGFAIYLISARESVPILGLWKYFGLVNLTAAATLLIWSIPLGEFQTITQPKLWLFALLLAVFPGILGHAIYNWSIPRLDTIDVGIATLGEPILGTIIAWIFLSEELSNSEIIGIFLLLLAIGFTIERKQN
ncbi:MAG: DMT family transporter [Candidatus Kariarchaeaceae archaeon]